MQMARQLKSDHTDREWIYTWCLTQRIRIRISNYNSDGSDAL